MLGNNFFKGDVYTWAGVFLKIKVRFWKKEVRFWKWKCVSADGSVFLEMQSFLKWGFDNIEEIPIELAQIM